MRYIAIASLFILLGCYNSRKAEKQLNKAQISYPEVVAKKTTQWYPCLPLRSKIDSSLYKQWMRGIDSLNELYNSFKPDTVYIDNIVIDSAECLNYYRENVGLKSKLVRANQFISSFNKKVLVMPVIHDTIIKIDSANSVVQASKIEALIKEKDSYSKKYTNSLRSSIWFLIALIVSLLINVIKFSKKTKTFL